MLFNEIFNHSIFLQNTKLSIINYFKECINELTNKLNNGNKEEVFKHLDHIVNICDNLDKITNKDDKKEFKKQFQKIILELTNQSELCYHCYKKPKGYAGDFIAMEMIWDGRNKPWKTYQGSTDIGRILNAFTLESPNCAANEYRVHYLKKILSEYKDSKIASIGSGGIIEIRELEKENRLNNNEFHLFDSDSSSFLYIKERYDKFDDLKIHEGNILRTILNEDLPKFDLIYSSGMFDYFDLKSSKKLIKILWKFLNKKGKLIITNSNPNNMSRFWMEYAMEWYLVHKSYEEMLELSNTVSDNKNPFIEKDPYNVYQYLHLIKC